MGPWVLINARWYQTLNHYRVANPPIQFHSLHPPPFAPKCKGLSLTEFCSGATRLSGRFSEGLLLRRSQQVNDEEKSGDFLIINRFAVGRLR